MQTKRDVHAALWAEYDQLEAQTAELYEQVPIMGRAITQAVVARLATSSDPVASLVGQLAGLMQARMKLLNQSKHMAESEGEHGADDR